MLKIPLSGCIPFCSRLLRSQSQSPHLLAQIWAAVRSELDISGRNSALYDQLGRKVASSFVGMTGTPISSSSAETGQRWLFQNVLGGLVQAWDDHGRSFWVDYDELYRPLSVFVQDAGQNKILFNYVVYGDRHPNAVQLNLLGAAYQVFDQAGMIEVPAIDFQGNPTSVQRVLAKDYTRLPDWSTLAAQTSYAALQSVFCSGEKERLALHSSA